jgi:hypothetical protein
MTDPPAENVDPFAALEAAERLLQQAGDEVAARTMGAIAALAAREVLRCLDPRHATTHQQAVDAVFSASPFSEALSWAADGERRFRPGA